MTEELISNQFDGTDAILLLQFFRLKKVICICYVFDLINCMYLVCLAANKYLIH